MSRFAVAFSESRVIHEPEYEAIADIAERPEGGVEMSDSACEVCNGSSFSPKYIGLVDYLTGEIFDVIGCHTCSLLRTDPLPAEEKIGDYYPPRYRGNRHSFTGQLRCKLRGRAVAKRFPTGFTGRLLDVGCGNGAFARHMHRLGWQVSATEIDPDVVARLRTEGIDARQPGEAEFEQPFDVITSWHVFEHVRQPLELARRTRTLLKPGGIVQFTVPNVRCLQSRVLGRNWMHLDVPRHRHHFSYQTFMDLMRRAEFRVVGRANLAIEYDWFGVIQSVLNLFCQRQNVLFDKLTAAPQAPGQRPSKADQIASLLLGPPLAAASLPVVLLGAAFGDGATLTLTAEK